VRVKAAGLNRADIYRCGEAMRSPGWPPTPGTGVRRARWRRWPGVTRWRPGDRVMDWSAAGAQAELVKGARPRRCRSREIGLCRSRCHPEVFYRRTMLLSPRPVQRGNEWLIHASQRAVGTAAAQLAEASGGTGHRNVGAAPTSWRARGPTGGRRDRYQPHGFAGSVSEPVKPGCST